MKKITHLVQVNDLIGTNVVLPLSIGVLWQHAQQSTTIQQQWQLGKVIYKKIDPVEISELAQANMICFSTYIWNSAYHVWLAQQLKKINPDIFVVFGGPHISVNRKDFWAQHSNFVDLAIVGEGEQSFNALLESWPDYCVQEIPGAWTADYFDGEAPRTQTFDSNTSPYLAGFYDDIVKHELSQGHIIQAVLQTNRGCPYHCTFCEEGSDYKNKIYWYDHQRVRDEIKWCAQNQVAYLSIADDNWGISDADVELMRWIRDCKLQYGYPETIDATWAKNAPDRILKMAEIDREHNTHLIRAVTVAMQSMNTGTLSTIKRFNLVPNKQHQLIQGLNQMSVPTYTEIIWPLPYETVESFLAGLDQVMDMGLQNWLDVYPLNIFEGTELHVDHAKDYNIVIQRAWNANRDDWHEPEPIVKSSIWADADSVVYGQLVSTWLVCLFFLGFARNSMQWAHSQGCTRTEFVKKFIEFVKNCNSIKIQQAHDAIDNWWQCYLSGNSVPNISMFPEHDTTHWFPYSHLAARLQHQHNEFVKVLNEFMKDQFDVSVDLDSTSIVKYNCQSTKLTHNPPEFANEFEFCRFYYWWKRKSGYNRITER